MLTLQILMQLMEMEERKKKIAHNISEELTI